MSERDILIYPKDEKALRSRSAAVRSFDQEVRGLIRDLKQTLAAHQEGIGLAAPQINVHQRVVIVRLGKNDEPAENRHPAMALVNPVILRAGDDRRDFDGCLSFPGLYGETVRPHYLYVSFLDEAGRPQTVEFRGFDAVLVHHEIDHLEGVLFIDRIEKFDDLYRIGEDEFGSPIRIPVSSPILTDPRPSDLVERLINPQFESEKLVGK